MITLQWLYTLAGLMFAAFALLSAVDASNPKRLGNAAFWGRMALSLLVGDRIGDFANGLLVLGLAGLAGFGMIGRSHPPTTTDEERQVWSGRLGNRLFLPALIIPATALFGTLLYNYTPLGTLGWFEAKRETYVLLGLGVLLAIAAIFVWLKPPAIAPRQEGRGGGRRRRDRHAGRLLRDFDDADGGQLQSRPRRFARAQGQERRHQGADRDRDSTAGRQHPADLLSRLLTSPSPRRKPGPRDTNARAPFR